jgi:hypothetical protein
VPWRRRAAGDTFVFQPSITGETIRVYMLSPKRDLIARSCSCGSHYPAADRIGEYQRGWASGIRQRGCRIAADR